MYVFVFCAPCRFGFLKGAGSTPRPVRYAPHKNPAWMLSARKTNLQNESGKKISLSALCEGAGWNPRPTLKSQSKTV